MIQKLEQDLFCSSFCMIRTLQKCKVFVSQIDGKFLAFRL